eukprot:39228-Eustigmatos_ZCMA.PRE.1
MYHPHTYSTCVSSRAGAGRRDTGLGAMEACYAEERAVDVYRQSTYAVYRRTMCTHARDYACIYSSLRTLHIYW